MCYRFSFSFLHNFGVRKATRHQSIAEMFLFLLLNVLTLKSIAVMHHRERSGEDERKVSKKIKHRTFTFILDDHYTEHEAAEYRKNARAIEIAAISLIIDARWLFFLFVMLSHFLLNTSCGCCIKKRFIIPKDGNMEAQNISSSSPVGKFMASRCH